MATKLTKRTLDALKPRAARYELADTELPGFLVRVTPDGVKSFGLVYRAGTGRTAPKRRLTIGRYGPLTVDGARKIALEVIGEVRRGGDPVNARAADKQTQTVATLARQFLDDVRARRKPTTATEYARIVTREIVPAFGTRRVTDVTTPDLARLHVSMSERPYMANRVLSVLGAFFTWCELHGHRPRGSNPAPAVEPFPEHGRERFLSGTELARLGAALTLAERTGVPAAPRRKRTPATGRTAKHRPKSADAPKPSNPFAVGCIRFLLLSGWRESEARTLRWDALDTARGFATLADTKTGRSVRPLGAPVFALLDELPRVDGSPYVFPGARTDVPLVNLSRTWEAVRVAAKLPGVRLHDLRHTAAARAAAGGLSLLQIGVALGHRNQSTTQKYAHLADDPRRLAADRIAADVAAALAGGTAPAVVLPFARRA